MDYRKILRQIAEKEHISVKEVEKEMADALKSAGIDCSVKEFIEATAKTVKSRL